MAGPVEDSEKEGYCSSDDDNTPQMKNARNKLYVLCKFHCITEYQELKLVANAKEKQYTQNMYSSNHLKFNQDILNKWTKDRKNMARSAKEKFSKNIDRKRISREMTRLVIFPAQETDFLQRIIVRCKQGLCVSGQWEKVTMIRLIYKAFQNHDSNWLIIKGIEIQKRLYAQTDMTPLLLFQKKEQ